MFFCAWLWCRFTARIVWMLYEVNIVWSTSCWANRALRAQSGSCYSFDNIGLKFTSPNLPAKMLPSGQSLTRFSILWLYLFIVNFQLLLLIIGTVSLSMPPWHPHSQSSNTTRCAILTCGQKLTNSQLNLPHGTRPKKRVMKKLKTTKPRCSEETVQSYG